MAPYSDYLIEDSISGDTTSSSGDYVSAVSSLAGSTGMMPLPPPRSQPVSLWPTTLINLPGGGAPLHSHHSQEGDKGEDVFKDKEAVESDKVEETSKGKEVVRDNAPDKGKEPAVDKPVEGTWQPKGEEVVRSKGSASDEEDRLLTASGCFATQVGPLMSRSTLPPSIRPTMYQYNGGIAFPTGPTQPTQALTHAPGSHSSHTSNAFTSWSSQPAPREDDPMFVIRGITNRLAMASIWIRRSTGLPPALIAQHERMMNEISQQIITALDLVCRERDDARREVQRLMQQVMRNEDASKAERDQLNRELNRMISRESSIQKEVDRQRENANKLKIDLVKMEKEAKDFRAHHEKMVGEWGQRDDQQFKHVQGLEGELKRLRARNAELAKKTGEEPEDVSLLRPDFSSPSVPESHKKNTLPASPAKNDTDGQKVLLGLLNDKYGTVSGDVRTTGVPLYNPRGHRWNAATSSTQRPLTMVAGGSTQGNPSNWPTVIQRQNTAGPGHYGGQASTGVEAGPSREPTAKTTSIARHKDDWEIEDIVNATEHLEQLTKGYIVQCHPITEGAEPPRVHDIRLPVQEPITWDYLVHLVCGQSIDDNQVSNHMAYLLSVKAFRPYIVMRVTLDYLHKKILSPQLFLGIDDGRDKHLEALQARIGTINQLGTYGGSRERQIVINDHARIVRHTFQNPSMASRMVEFRENSINSHAHILSEILKPLRPESVTDEVAIRAMRIVVAATWDISAKVWMSGMTLHFLFPDCGSKFAEGSMKAINLAQFGMRPAELQFLQTRVSFVVSPSLTIRDERDENNMICQRIRKAEVIIMK